MSLVATDAEFPHLFVRDFNTDFIIVGVQHSFDPQPTFGPGGSDEIDDRCIVPKRLSFPGEANKPEQPVLYPIPLARSRRLMTYRDGDADLISQFLQVYLPSPRAATMASARVCANEQAPG